MRRGVSTRSLFPVGLYGCLVLALFSLVQPGFVRQVQSLCGAVMCLPFRAYGLLVPTLAGASAVPDEAVAAARVEALARRQLDEVARRRPRQIASGLEPILCRVIERRDPGGGGQPSVLVLDRTVGELRGCARFVTLEDALVGFLAEPEGRAPDAPARVFLLHHREPGCPPRRVPAEVRLGPAEGRGERRLGLLVEPASSIDAWPLRCSLLDDPYLAAGFDPGELSVHTRGFADDPLGALPVGLRLGRLAIWGYVSPAGKPLPIGFYVDPAWPARSIHRVVLWRGPIAAETPVRGPLAGGAVHPVSVLRLTVPSRATERWFLTSGAPALRLRRGSSVLCGGRFIGAVETGGPGYAVVRPFGAPGGAERQPVTLLPDADGLPSCDLLVRPVSRVGQPDGSVLVGLEVDGQGVGLPPGQLFTGTRGPDAPSGLWIGEAEGGAVPGTLVVRHVEPQTGQRAGVGVFMRAASPEEGP